MVVLLVRSGGRRVGGDPLDDEPGGADDGEETPLVQAVAVGDDPAAGGIDLDCRDAVAGTQGAGDAGGRVAGVQRRHLDAELPHPRPPWFACRAWCAAPLTSG
jgi:hypothetical protein